MVVDTTCAVAPFTQDDAAVCATLRLADAATAGSTVVTPLAFCVVTPLRCWANYHFLQIGILDVGCQCRAVWRGRSAKEDPLGGVERRDFTYEEASWTDSRLGPRAANAAFAHIASATAARGVGYRSTPLASSLHVWFHPLLRVDSS